MKNNITLTEFEQKIQVLEIQSKEQYLDLKLQFDKTLDSLKPINLIKTTIKDFYSSSEIKTDVLNSFLSFASGSLVKKIVVGNSESYFKNIAGNVIESFVANKVYTNIDEIKGIGSSFLKNFFKKKTK